MEAREGKSLSNRNRKSFAMTLDRGGENLCCGRGLGAVVQPFCRLGTLDNRLSEMRRYLQIGSTASCQSAPKASAALNRFFEEAVVRKPTALKKRFLCGGAPAREAVAQPLFFSDPWTQRCPQIPMCKSPWAWTSTPRPVTPTA